jgi:hypothetical protein
MLVNYSMTIDNFSSSLHRLVRQGMSVNEHDTLSNVTFRYSDTLMFLISLYSCL